jgi:predicted Zn-dependent protease
MSFKWKGFWVASLALVVCFQACGMHSWEELLVSTDDEKQMGHEFDSLVRVGDKSVMQSGETIFTPANVAQKEFYEYYQAKAKEIVNKIREDDWEALKPSGNVCNKKKCTKDNFFEFNIINSKTVNAFAVPGGYVYFYTAILKNFQSESELMSVLGHEVGHVVLHHSRDRMVKAAGASAIISIFLGDGIAGLIGQLGAYFWLNGHSQDNESESDSMGFYYTNAIGISSVGLSDFFGRNLKSWNAADKSCDEKDEGSWADVLSTHPPSCKRVMNNRKRMANQNFPIDRPNLSNGKTYKQLVDAAKL